MSLLLKKANFMGGASVVVPTGNIDIPANDFFAVSSTVDGSNVGVRINPNGGYEYTNNEFGSELDWQQNNNPYPNDYWIDDGGASASQFEARLQDLNTFNLYNPTWVGWDGFTVTEGAFDDKYTEWLNCNQMLALYAINDQPAPSDESFIVYVFIREIANPTNIISDYYEIYCNNV